MKDIKDKNKILKDIALVQIAFGCVFLFLALAGSYYVAYDLLLGDLNDVYDDTDDAILVSGIRDIAESWAEVGETNNNYLMSKYSLTEDEYRNVQKDNSSEVYLEYSASSSKIVAQFISEVIMLASMIKAFGYLVWLISLCLGALAVLLITQGLTNYVKVK
ncbi:MAG: hypothetical protein ABIG93_03690 [archaeon]|nr:hypothetical protein [Nanoarchaeota archaeon]